MGPYSVFKESDEVFALLVSKGNDGNSFLEQERNIFDRVYGTWGLLWNLKQAAEISLPKQMMQ